MNKICTTIEQSKKLIELGIDINTADMLWTYDFTVNDINGLNVISENLKPEENDIPAWSLSALFDVLPKIIRHETLFIETSAVLWHIGYISIITTRADNLVNACVDLIIELHELKML